MKKVTGTISTMPAGLAIGLLAGLSVTAAGSCIVAWMIQSEKLAESSAGIGSAAILLLAAMTAALTSWMRIRHRRVMVCMCSGALYYLSLLCITALFFGGVYQGMAVTGLIVFGGSMCAALLGLSRGGKRYGRRIKIRR